MIIYAVTVGTKRGPVDGEKFNSDVVRNRFFTRCISTDQVARNGSTTPSAELQANVGIAANNIAFIERSAHKNCFRRAATLSDLDSNFIANRHGACRTRSNEVALHCTTGDLHSDCVS